MVHTNTSINVILICTPLQIYLYYLKIYLKKTFLFYLQPPRYTWYTLPYVHISYTRTTRTRAITNLLGTLWHLLHRHVLDTFIINRLWILQNKQLYNKDTLRHWEEAGQDKGTYSWCTDLEVILIPLTNICGSRPTETEGLRTRSSTWLGFEPTISDHGQYILCPWDARLTNWSLTMQTQHYVWLSNLFNFSTQRF